MEHSNQNQGNQDLLKVLCRLLLLLLFSYFHFHKSLLFSCRCLMDDTFKGGAGIDAFYGQPTTLLSGNIEWWKMAKLLKRKLC